MAELDYVLTLADVLTFTFGVLLWAATLVGSCALVVVVLHLIDLWQKR